MAQPAHQRRWQLGGLVVVTTAAVAIAVSVLGGGAAPALVPGAAVPHAGEVRALFAGLPERGAALGPPRAPVTLTEFADLQCPVCAAFARDVLPALIRREVRPGRLRIVFSALAFIGADSARGARMALAAGAQNRLWPLADLFFLNQRDENSGYVTDAFLTALAEATPGLDPAAALARRSTPAVSAALTGAARQASRLGVASTPSFTLMRTGSAAVSFKPADLQASSFTGPIERLAGVRAR